jgi:hypothetical protein
VDDKQLTMKTQLNKAISLLRDLADLQNGAPLEQHRKEWEQTMNEVYEFLNQTEPETERKLLIDFFMFFQQNAKNHIGKTIGEFVDLFLKNKAE